MTKKQERLLGANLLKSTAANHRCLISLAWLRWSTDFRPPEGSNAAELDACTLGPLMAVLDLRMDDSLAEAGLAREVVNRVQKLRKKAGTQCRRPGACVAGHADCSGGCCEIAGKPDETMTVLVFNTFCAIAFQLCPCLRGS